MKRTSWVAGALALGAFVFASGLDAQDVSVGVKAGVSISNISTDQADLVDTGSRTGLAGGAFLSFALSDLFAIQPEILYVQKGFELSAGDASAEAELDYIEIPVLFKVMPGQADQKVRPALFAGGFLAFEASCSLSGDFDGTEVDDLDCDEPGADFERETTDYGITFGAGVDIHVSDNLFVTLDGRYNLGLADLESEESADSVKSRGWLFMGGVGIPLGG